MTFEQMKATVKGFCNLTSDEADLRVGQSINRHYKRVTAKCGLDATRFVTRTTTTTTGVQTVTFSEIERVDRIIDTTSGVDPLTESSLDTLRLKTPGTGAPREWAKQTTTARTFTVRLDTVPQDPYTLQADGWTTLSDLTGTDEPVFPESFHDILTWYVIAEELLKKEKDKLALKYETKAEGLLEELQQHYAESYSQVTKARNENAQSGSTSGSGSSGSGSLGNTAYTQTALVTYDRGVGAAPFAVVSGAAKVANLDADLLDGESGDYYLTRGNHMGVLPADALSVTSDRLIGRDTAGVGAYEEISVGGGIEFSGSTALRIAAFTGDVTKTAGGTAQTIASDAVTYAKMQNVSAASRLLGRGSASGSGDPEELTVGTGLEIAGTTLQTTLTPVRVLDRDVSVATVENTTVATAVYTCTVPGGTLGTSKALRMSLRGDLLNNTGGAVNLTITVTYGATTVFSYVHGTGSTAGRRGLSIVTFLSAQNSATAQTADTEYEYDGVAGGVTGTGNVMVVVGGSHDSVAENSAADKDLVVTVQWASASSSASFRARTVFTELLP